MKLMTAFGWLSGMLLIGIMCRAKIKLFRNILMPASVIGGLLGFILLNTGILSMDNSAVYNDMTGLLFTLSFISLGLTASDDTQNNGSTAKQIFKGSVAIGAVWVLLWSITPLIGYLVAELVGKPFAMDGVYGLLIPAAFCDGPGQAVIFGTIFEQFGWSDASQVAVTFASIGFFIAFVVGVPLAKLGMSKGLASCSGEIEPAVARGLFQTQEQKETLGFATTYNGNLDTLTLHLALMGVCFLGAKFLAALIAMIPGSFWEILSSLLFMHGLIVAYGVRWVMNRLHLSQYRNDILQARLTGTCTDLLVCSAFMAIQVSIVAKWIVPILAVCVVVGVVSFFTAMYFGPRMGGNCDFERTLGLWGCITGTCPTGIALIRIADPNLQTTAATELGAMNVIAMILSLAVYVVVPSMAGGEASMGMGIVVCLITALVCLIVLKVCGAWGKPTFSFRKGKMPH